MIIEVEKVDGSRYAIDLADVSAILLYSWKQLEGQATETTTMVLKGGQEYHIKGVHYEELLKIWKRAKKSASLCCSSMAALQVEPKGS